MKTIIRYQYLNRMIALKGSSDIKVITGIRRSGKSKLMDTYIEYLVENDTNANIIKIDFTNLMFENLQEYHALNEYIENKFVATKNNYLFVDEVQMCKNFELAINSLHSSGKYDIYVTGSNAFLLSSDLATLFTGRFIEIHVFPFDFQEYREYHDNDTDIDSLFDRYVLEGGLAGSYIYPTEQDKKQYISGVYNTIVTRDLVTKYNIKDHAVLKNLSEYLMDNVSNLTSPNKICDTMLSNKYSTSQPTIRKFVQYLCNAFVFYDVKRYDIKGKKYLISNDKYYLCDTGIRYAILGSRNMDFGRMYENIVCIELLRRGYEVYIGKLYEKEIDFVAKKGSEQLYIQVSDNIENQSTLEREYSPLLRINDAYPKIIIARTKHEKYSYEGISVIDIARWLLDK